jgi:hypothetical protein
MKGVTMKPDILLTAIMGDGQRWGLFPAAFTEEELEPYRHIFKAWGISELEPGEPVKFYSTMTREKVFALLDKALRVYNENQVKSDN